MFEDQSNRSRIIAATMRLAAERNWRELSLRDIAAAAGVGLADLRKEFCSKTEILAAFRSEVDKSLLARVSGAGTGEGPRDRLFDVIMTRFEIMAPYRPALRRIWASLCCSPGDAAFHFLPTMNSQYWMLEAAGINAEGGSAFRVPGLAVLYAQVFRVWLKDEDPGLAHTMAVLDKRLRRAENLNMRINALCEAGRKALCALSPRYRRKAQEEGAGGGPAPAGGAVESSTPGAGDTSARPQPI